MCLQDRFSPKKLKEFKKNLPETFFVWKIMAYGGRTRFFSSGTEQMLDEKGIYFARNCPAERVGIPYKPGFHVFLSKDKARSYNTMYPVRKFTAKRTWVKVVGEIYGIESLVLSRIEVI